MLGNIHCYYYAATVPVDRAQSHNFSVAVTKIIDIGSIIKSNNLFSYGIKVRLWSTKLKLIKLPSYS